MTGLEIVIALAIAIGLVGMLVPALPGSLLVGAGVLLWAIDRSETTAWVVAVLAIGLLVTGAVVKYLVPGRRLQRAGVPTSTLAVGAVLGVVGFFVVPVVGLPIGFVVGVYLSEVRRAGRRDAWPATLQAVRAIGLGIVIELGFGILAAGTWAVGVLVS
ncbi:MAG TPA: DUF456 domain-containing protein [Marmoricola sp.]|nr:DUF456 domain-containing protein [Marmoricola sp.]